MRRAGLLFFLIGVVVALSASPVSASHSWGGYHWARTSNPFTLLLGDNVTSAWDGYLATTSSDWTQSDVLDTTIVPGATKPRPCGAVAGNVQVCDASYGNNGWLGLAQIWLSGQHITQGVVKVNDFYFNTATYNTPGWRQMVMCQEVGHTLGLDHQDTNFNNTNLGTCMDYTSNPLGPPSNLHPNTHDYDELHIIYSHLDGTTTVGTTATAPTQGHFDTPAEWGRLVRGSSSPGSVAVYQRDLARGKAVVTFVIWAR